MQYARGNAEILRQLMRHITARDRIIYDIYDERITVLIIQAEEHYDDK